MSFNARSLSTLGIGYGALAINTIGFINGVFGGSLLQRVIKNIYFKQDTTVDVRFQQ